MKKNKYLNYEIKQSIVTHIHTNRNNRFFSLILVIEPTIEKNHNHLRYTREEEVNQINLHAIKPLVFLNLFYFYDGVFLFWQIYLCFIFFAHSNLWVLLLL